jgi:hypothetical protein
MVQATVAATLGAPISRRIREGVKQLRSRFLVKAPVASTGAGMTSLGQPFPLFPSLVEHPK